MTFLGDEYGKPKLTETKILKKIINDQIVEVPQEEKIFNYLYDFILNNYKIIFISLIVLYGLYWRYLETKKNKLKRYNNNYSNNNYSNNNYNNYSPDELDYEY
jgi:hypothetical protein